MPRLRAFPRPLSGAALLLATLAFAAAPPAPRPRTREQEIADVEKQIADLQKRLAELKRAAGLDAGLPPEWAKALTWRGIGPASMGGRIVALAVFPGDPTTWWVATASGGLLKTTNNGVTFEHQFDREATVSVGDVAVAPSDRNVVWVGTGENNPRNSVSFGDGAYKSTDGGKTWRNMGLKNTFQIGRIAIHPTNPNVVYVGALGRLYGPNEERGLFKTTDGGKTWQKVLYVDSNTGVIDVQMSPGDPETLLVATWERRRDGFDSHAGALAGAGKADPALPAGYDAYDPVVKWGKGSGIWKTTDGGRHWQRVTSGLPTVAMGRIGIDYYRKDPRIVYAVVDSEKIGMGTAPTWVGVQSADAPGGGARVMGVLDDSPAAKAGLKVEDVITAVGGEKLKGPDRLGELIRARRPGEKVKLAVVRAGKPLELVATLEARPTAPPRRLDFEGVETAEGVRVVKLMPGGPSARAGLKFGDVLLEIDKKKVKSLKEALAAVRALPAGQKSAWKVLRGKEVKALAWVAPAAPRRASRPYSAYIGGQRENQQDAQGHDGFQYGGVYKSTDGGESWARVNSLNPRPMYFSQVRADPSDDKTVYVLGIRMHFSTDGGKTFRMGRDRAVHADQHALWVDPRDGRHLLVGTDGGAYASYDRGAHWDFLSTAAIGQFYSVCVDSRRPYRVYGGLQDNGSWGGPSRGPDGRGPVNSDWFIVNGNDGFACAVAHDDPDVVFAEGQEGNMVRRNLRTGERRSVKPVAPSGQPPYRFNWNTPMLVSVHNPRVFYTAGNFVFRSLERGSRPKAISPELTKNGKASATALAESPRNPDVLWAGTDDGNLWVTKDGGANWANVTNKVGLPRPYWVASVEASRFADGRAYVAFDAHRSNDDAPYVYVTEDFGQTWKSLRANLPVGPTRVLREDRENEGLLYLGTEFAVWASVDRGASWTRINSNLPTVAVHELAQATTASELVAATHGRSLWILDVSALRQIRPQTREAAATLFRPAPAVRWQVQPLRGTVFGPGSRGYIGENPPAGAQVYYALTRKADKAKLEVQNYAGKVLATLPVQTGPGLHRVTWNLVGVRLEAPRPGGLMGLVTGAPRGPLPAGEYRVVLRVDGVEQIQPLRIENDPNVPEAGTGEVEAPGRRRERVVD